MGNFQAVVPSPATDQPSAHVTDDSNARTWHKDLAAAAILVLSACLLHGHGLTLGFWFDDNNHLELCQRHGFANLASGNRFDWNNNLAHAWWAKKETGWAYFRPLSVAVRTSLWQMFGLQPLPFHILHLALYSLTVALFYGLLRRCGWTLTASFVAVLFFVLHPANCLTTPWLANDGPVLVGLWTVVGLWLFHASAQSGHARPGLLAGVFLCYALAMLSRENGIALGPLLVLFDWLMGKNGRKGEGEGRRGEGEKGVRGSVSSNAHSEGDASALPISPSPLLPFSPSSLRALTIYIGLAFEGVTFLVVRAWCLGEVPLPRSPYFHWPLEPGFLSWMSFKLLNEMVCLPLGLPFVPIVEVPWWQQHPVTTAMTVLLLGFLAVKFFTPLKRSRLAWGVLGGVVIAQAPTMAVFSAPYNYYLATAGWAVLLAAWGRQVYATRPRFVKTVLGTMAVCYLIGLWAGSWMVHSAATAERLVRTDVLAAGAADSPPGTRLFFINMPFFAIEVAPSLRLATNRPDLEVYPLTFAPEVFFPRTEVTVEQEDDRTLLVRAGDIPLFAGEFGDRVQLGWYGACRDDLPVGPVHIPAVAGPMPFQVEVVRADARGISELRLVFDRPLADPGYRFFLGSNRALAQELHFGRTQTASMPFATSVTLNPPRAATPLEERDFDRLRRMEISTGICLRLLANWPY